MKQKGSRVLQNETTATANKWCIMKQKGSIYAKQNYRNYKSMMHHQAKSSKISRTKLWQKLQSNAIVKQKSSRFLQNETIETANQWAMNQKGLRFLENETTAIANQCGVKLKRAQDLQKSKVQKLQIDGLWLNHLCCLWNSSPCYNGRWWAFVFLRLQHAYTVTDITSPPSYKGTEVFINVWEPVVVEPHDFSLAQLWFLNTGLAYPSSSSSSLLNTIEAGWQVKDPKTLNPKQSIITKSSSSNTIEPRK